MKLPLELNDLKAHTFSNLVLFSVTLHCIMLLRGRARSMLTLPSNAVMLMSGHRRLNIIALFCLRVHDKCHIVFLGSGQLTNCPKGFELSSNSGQTSTLRVVMAFLGEGSQRISSWLEKKFAWICITGVHL